MKHCHVIITADGNWSKSLHVRLLTLCRCGFSSKPHGVAGVKTVTASITVIRSDLRWSWVLARLSRRSPKWVLTAMERQRNSPGTTNSWLFSINTECELLFCCSFIPFPLQHHLWLELDDHLSACSWAVLSEQTDDDFYDQHVKTYVYSCLNNQEPHQRSGETLKRYVKRWTAQSYCLSVVGLLHPLTNNKNATKIALIKMLIPADMRNRMFPVIVCTLFKESSCIT